MKKALAFLNIGGSSLHPKSRASFEHAAKRWGADLVEIKEQIAPGVHHFWQKTHVIETLKDYDHVLQLDADMLIWKFAPSPFDVVPCDHLGLVDSHQYMRHSTHYKGKRISERYWAKRLGVKQIRGQHHLNGGFFLYSPECHRDLFAEWRKIGKAANWIPKFLPEQCSLSTMLQSGVEKWTAPVVWLPHRWNVVGVQQSSEQSYHFSIHEDGRLAPHSMDGYIYHFTWAKDRSKRIDSVGWQDPPKLVPDWKPAQAVCRRLDVDKKLRGAEVGVLRGLNASSILRARENVSMYLVDRWAAFEDGSSYRESRDGNSQWNDDQAVFMLNETLNRLRPVQGRFQILQGDSVQMANAIEDESLDFVFVDGDHSREGCLRDIKAYLPKIRRGPDAWIGGHDFGVKWGGHWGVKEAVLEVFNEKDVELDVGSTWFVRLK